jgi:hypothetical protein
MQTLLAKPEKHESEFQLLRGHVERQLKEIKMKVAAMEALLDEMRAAEASSPQPSALDDVQELLKVTEDLRASSGKLSAEAVAKVFGVSVNELAGWLGRSRQSLSKTPDADSIQNDLAFFEHVARLRAVVKGDHFRKWLRMSNDQLDGESPLELLAAGNRQVVVDFVEDILTGNPS